MSERRARNSRSSRRLLPSAGDLLRLERACAGRSFQQRRDAAVIAVFRATGMRLSELAGIRYVPDDQSCSDVDLCYREITVRGKGGKTRVVKIGYDAARSLDRYIRSGPGTRRRTGRSCGSGSTTAAR
jgi:site-specific recombinase XerD